MHVSRRRLAITALLASASIATPAFAQADPQRSRAGSGDTGPE